MLGVNSRLFATYYPTHGLKTYKNRKRSVRPEIVEEEKSAERETTTPSDEPKIVQIY